MSDDNSAGPGEFENPEPAAGPARAAVPAHAAASGRSKYLATVSAAIAPYLRKRSVQAGLAVACVALLALGAVLVFAGWTAQQDPPTAPAPRAGASAGGQVPTEELTGSVTSTGKTKSTTSPEPAITGTGSTPIRIRVPAIGVDANVLVLGLNADKTVQVPPLNQVGDAGWYKYSPVPGAVGPSVILGHIDSAGYGLGVFFKLGDLRPGDTVTVVRADQMVATFAVTSVAEYPKTSFPTQKVYGNTSGSALRLVTCGGKFNASTSSYLDNIVVFGNLVSLKHT